MPASPESKNMNDAGASGDLWGQLQLLALSGVAGGAFAQKNPRGEFTTNYGPIGVELYPDRAPETVRNFLQYVKEGHYEGTVFHRVIRGFMAQGGGFTADFKEKPVREPIKNEADNGLTNIIGSVAMARTSDPHSASAQFFINVANNSSLNFTSKTESGWGYTVFGRVVKGMDVVQRISTLPTDGGDVPLQTVTIESATIKN